MSSRRLVPVPLAIFAVITVVAAAAAAQKVTPEELVKRHLEQTYPAGAAEPSRTASGVCRVSSLLGAGTVEGPFGLRSDVERSQFDLRFGIPTYEGETIVFDGKGVDVGFAQRRTSTRSALGSFLSTYSVILSDGLFGGVLNRRWSLRDLQARDTKLSYDGRKKLDGRELHRVRYRVPRSQGDLTVHLYFELDTFRHVASVYAASRSHESSALQPTALQADERITVSEKFSNLDTTPAGVVPQAWLLHYTRTGDRTVEWKYECTVQSVTNGA